MVVNPFAEWPLKYGYVLLIVATVLGMIAGGWGLLGDMRAVRALVDEGGWTATGAFSADSGMSNPSRIPAELWSDPSFRYWQAWSAANTPLTGTIETSPFKSPCIRRVS